MNTLFTLFLRLKRSPLNFLTNSGFLSPNHHKDMVPRNIFIYWNQGETLAPALVKLCIDSWRVNNPDWSLTVLDKQTANEELSRVNLPTDITEASYSDLLRLHLLEKYGGIWADATTLCLNPLDHWVHTLLLTSDVFLFTNPTADRPIASWFIASRKNSAGIRFWNQKSQEFWAEATSQPREYFWLHYLFQYLTLRSRGFRLAFKNMPRVSAAPHHSLCFSMRGSSITDQSSILCMLEMTNIQKLSYKHGYDAQNIIELLDYLKR